MRKIKFFLLGIFMPFLLSAQTLNVNTITDWSTLRQSGFFESTAGNTTNLPTKDNDWYWGINIAHGVNKTQTVPYHFGGQMVFQINRTGGLPSVYIRSTTQTGSGLWAKLLYDQGIQNITGDLSVSELISSKELKSTNGNFTGNLTVGNISSTSSNAIRILAPNAPVGEDNVKDISFEFAGAGKSVIRAYRSTTWNNYMQFLTTDSDASLKVRMHIHYDGKIGIGTVSPRYNLDVNGTIRAKEVKIETGWADFVFNKDYKLPTLSEVESHIQEFGHLPGIPSEEEVKENGIGLSEITTKLLQKIEELTLYTLQQEKRAQEQDKRLEKQEKLINELINHLGNK